MNIEISDILHKMTDEELFYTLRAALENRPAPLGEAADSYGDPTHECALVVIRKIVCG
jgi:hypothetical protein